MVLARGRSAWWLVLLAATGCRQIFGLSDPIDAGGTGGDGKPTDTAGDVGGDGAGTCYGETGWRVCLAAPPTSPVTLTGPVDSESQITCMSSQPTSWSGAGQPRACFIVGTTITVNNAYATGAYPLVLVASDAINVSSLDVSAHGGGADPGAGGSPIMGCSFATSPQNDGSGGGGGAGGTLATSGGDGGTGNAAAANGGQASTGGAPAMLRGGCRGQSGGDGGALGSGGRGGDGGGAVYLVAGNSITITSSINASGAGARGGATYAGGGGGGAGGMIVLNAPTITASGAVLIANGGGGGAGGTATVGGGNGTNPTTSAPTSAAGGGTSGGAGGGAGAVGSVSAGNGAAGAAGIGGGGGGGDIGYLRSNHALSGATTSPAPTIQ